MEVVEVLAGGVLVLELDVVLDVEVVDVATGGVDVVTGGVVEVVAEGVDVGVTGVLPEALPPKE
ncbi:hypothetical protein [Yimella sp. cx-51]|uniref:hypothetical protein n=1 Tax=Yimella sp. cx-51 TaxID=2770551 RepID=UPI00165E2331|nr:hypothetical protein [Yimella sp. cx-51]MBC9958026.1 hypothetical protein [Yimella sp. cx-51]QTH38146.1 hypothetical protein J5M86_00095 [Yimella sp. cx-51]